MIALFHSDVKKNKQRSQIGHFRSLVTRQNNEMQQFYITALDNKLIKFSSNE